MTQTASKWEAVGPSTAADLVVMADGQNLGAFRPDIAHLIAAAPDLLAACEAVLKELILQRQRRPIPEEERLSSFDPAVNAARAAIAKAQP